MIVLKAGVKLEAVLAGAVSANQPETHVYFRDWNTEGTQSPPDFERTALNSATDVTICSAPVQNPKREIETVSIYNKDTANVTVTVKDDDGTTERILIRKTLATLETLHYESEEGWYVTNA